MKEINLLKLEKKHIKPVSMMLYRAFGDDDMKDIFPDPKEREVKSPYVNEFFLRREFSYFNAFITSPKLEGIAVWIPSDKIIDTPFWRMLTSGAIWPAIRIGYRALRKIQAYDQYIKRKHEELAPFKHLYLAVLAVDPKHQGKGYASKLLNEMLSEIDNEGLPCYVETEGENNVSMYRHFGFEVVDEFVVPDTTDNLIAMLRQPKTI